MAEAARNSAKACQEAVSFMEFGKKALPELLVPTGLAMSGRLDSNQRPPEPHSLGRGRYQPPNVTNASLLETYRFHSSHSLRGSQRKINDLPYFPGFSLPNPARQQASCNRA
jgi:hypothetical protein